MTSIVSNVPRVIDWRDPRRPGGAQGAPPPELPAGTTLACWLSPREVIHLESIEGEDFDGPGVSWAAVQWWIPIRDVDFSHPVVIDGSTARSE